MPRYRVTIKEILLTSVSIEADSLEDARKKWENGQGIDESSWGQEMAGVVEGSLNIEEED